MHLFRGHARGHRGALRHKANHDQHDEIQHQRDDADVETLAEKSSGYKTAASWWRVELFSAAWFFSA